jgi:hypothetical protein
MAVTVYYKGFRIDVDNCRYKIRGTTWLAFGTLESAKAHIDYISESQRNLIKALKNLKS